MGSKAHAQPDMPGRIVALIPAHDEEASIERTVTSLRAQTVRPDQMVLRHRRRRMGQRRAAGLYRLRGKRLPGRPLSPGYPGYPARDIRRHAS
jgi:hypothetical protein